MVSVPLEAYCTWCSCICLWEREWWLISYVWHKARKTDRTWGKHSQSFRAKHKELSCCFPLLFWPLVDPTNQQGSVMTSNLASISSLLPTDLSFRTTEEGNNKWYSLSQMSIPSSLHCCCHPKRENCTVWSSQDFAEVFRMQQRSSLCVCSENNAETQSYF